MKITKSQLKALIREQVAAVINETDWRDVEWMEDRFHDDQDDWPEEEEEEPEALQLPNPEKEPGGSSAFVDRVARRFRGEPPPIKRRPKQKMNPDTPPGERKRGYVYWDEEEGRNKVRLERKGRIKESELKDMIRVMLEEESELEGA